MTDRPYASLSPQELHARFRKTKRGSVERSWAVAEIEYRNVQVSIHRAAKPHWVAWATFVVAVLTFLVCMIGYWDQIVRLFRALRF